MCRYTRASPVSHSASHRLERSVYVHYWGYSRRRGEHTPFPGGSYAPTNSPTVGPQGGACQHSRIHPVECNSSSHSVVVSRSDVEVQPASPQRGGTALICTASGQILASARTNQGPAQDDLIRSKGWWIPNVYHDRRKLRERREGRSPVPTEYDFS